MLIRPDPDSPALHPKVLYKIIVRHQHDITAFTIYRNGVLMMLADDVIDAAKTSIGGTTRIHEHNDCIRIAYEWLDAQKKTKGFNKKGYALKHMIEGWAGRYVSQDDVEVAAMLHPKIKGKYPYFNISARLTEPSQKRLQGIGEAHKHNTYPRSSEAYLNREE